MASPKHSLREFFFGTTSRIAATLVCAVLVLATCIGFILTSFLSPTVDFGLHQKVSAALPLHLSFPEAMDHASVEQYLIAPTDLQFSSSWNGNVLVLTPKAKLELGKTYVVTLDGRAKKQSGESLGRSLTFSFDVTGAPVVAARVPPEDAKNVPLSASIVLVFDRPITALSQVQGHGTASLPVSISPAIAGRWRWIGTTAAEFVPDKPLTLATKYTVQVPAGIATITGDKTESDFSWSFETERPAVLSADPPEGNTDAGPTTEVSFTFNHEVDLQSVRAGLTLTEQGAVTKTVQSKSGNTKVDRPTETAVIDTSAPGKTIGFKAVRYAVIEGEDTKKITDKTTVIATPASPLRISTGYIATVAAGTKATNGNLGTEAAYSVSFSTVGPFKVTSAAYDNGALAFTFSGPVNDESLQKNVHFTPEVAGWKSDELETNDWESHKKLSFFPQLEPSTAYTFTFAQSFADRFGQTLAAPYEFKFTTPQLSPSVFLHPRGNDFGIFERGKPPVFFVNGVNVSSYQVELGKVSIEKFLQMRKEMQDDTNRSGIVDFRRVDLATFATDIQTVTLKPKAKHNVWESVPFDVAPKLGSGPQAGIYVMSLKAPEAKNTDGTPIVDRKFFSLTNLGLTLKYSGSKALVWVTDLQTGQPVAGATIQFRTLSAVLPASGVTDKNGFFETPITIADFKNRQYDYQPEFWVTATKGDDFSFVGSNWNTGINPYDFGDVYSDFRSPQSNKVRLESNVYTDRPLYRAGDTVYFKGIVRFLDWDGKYSIPANSKSVVLTINDPEGTQVYKETLPINAFGSFEGSFTAAKDASLGYYYMDGIVTPQDETGDQRLYGNFSVLAYRKPEYNVDLAAQQTEYFNHDTASVNVSGQYYFGAPMSGAKVHWQAYSTDYFFNKVTDAWYSFALSGDWCWRDCERGSSVLAEGDGVLDAAGRLTIKVPLNIDDKTVSQVVTVEATLTDKNNQEVSSSTDLVVHKSKVYVGIRSEEYGVASGGSASVQIITVSPDGKPAANRSVDLQLFSRTWETVKEQGVDSEFYYDNKPVDTPLRSFSAHTGADGKATVKIPLEKGGQYVVVATAKDDAGRAAKAGLDLYAWSDTYFNWPHPNNDRIEIIADKPSYKVGDTAKLIVKSPYQGKGVKALVTVERENVITKKIVDVTSNALPIEVPITEDLLPTAYVSVVIMKPRIGETFNENGLDTGAPAYKVGYVKLPLDTAPKKLTVTITTNKQRYLPGEKVTANLLATDAAGKPVRGEFSLAVVDMSLLDLSGFHVPDLVSDFYAERGIGVVTANMLQFLMERFKPGSKGGGGGDEERTRGNFLDTAYWNPTVLTDANGAATVTFTLPDNLTTWHFLAIGATKDSKFGVAAVTALETKNAIVRSVRPRFAVMGDKITLGAIVHNYLDGSKSFVVSLTGKGFDGSSKPQTVTVPSGGNLKVSFPVTVQQTGSLTLKFSAKTDGASDAVEETIPVYPFGTMQANATAGLTDTQATEKVFVPTLADAPTGSLKVNVAPSLGVYLPSGLSYLAEYPYGCAEQTASSFVGSAALAQLQKLGAFDVVSSTALRTNISVGLQKLYKFQRSDGGFGYWEDSDRSYPYLSAYILQALHITQAARFSVDTGVMERARGYLQDALHDSSKNSEANDPITRAYILFVLSEQGTTDVALLNNLYKDQVHLPLFAKAHLAMAFQKAGTVQAKNRAKELLADILSHVRVDDRGSRFEEGSDDYGTYMQTNDRTNALALQALIRIEPDNVMLPNLVRGMLVQRKDGHWDTTQSTVLSILSLVEFLKSTGELNFDYTAKVAVNAKSIISQKFTTSQGLLKKEVETALADLPRGKEIDVQVGKEGTGKLYYDLVLSYFYTPDSIEPADEGIGIQREIEPLSKGAAVYKIGETYRVTLTITVPETRSIIAVESPLPAGLEPIDLQFATSSQGERNEMQDMEYDSSADLMNAQWYFTHTEFRDDRVFMFAPSLPAGVYRYEYLVRATTPGKFKQRPARAFEMYRPEVFGQTDGGWVDVRE